MRHAIIIAAGAALALTACKKTESAEPAAGASEAATAAASEAAAVPAEAGAPADFTAGQAPSKAFLVGKWAEKNECDLAIDFKADGSMVGPFEKWDLKDGELEMIGNPQKIKLTVVDTDTMESQNGDDKPRTLVRCS